MVTTFFRLTTRKRGRRQWIRPVYTGITNREKQFQRSSRFVTLNFSRMPNAERKVEEARTDSRRGEPEKTSHSLARRNESDTRAALISQLRSIAGAFVTASSNKSCADLIARVGSLC